MLTVQGYIYAALAGWLLAVLIHGWWCARRALALAAILRKIRDEYPLYSINCEEERRPKDPEGISAEATVGDVYIERYDPVRGLITYRRGDGAPGAVTISGRLMGS